MSNRLTSLCTACAILVSAGLFQAQQPQIVAIAPSLDFPPPPQQTEIIVTFRGGAIDANISAFYGHLLRIGALPSRKMEVSGTGLHNTLIKENVLFAYYPDELNGVLATLNRGNREVRFSKATVKPSTGQNPSGGWSEPVFKSKATVVVPDLKLSSYDYLEVLQLEGRPLWDVASDRYLYRHYDPELGRTIPITRDKGKLEEVARLNPRLETKDHWRISEGRVVFPAEGFFARLFVATELVPKVLEFKRANVFLTVASSPTVKSFDSVEAPLSQPPQNTALLPCPEPLSSTFNKHLALIAYDLPVGIGQDDLDRPSIVVLDRFPPASDAQRAERQYLHEARELYEPDGQWSPIEMQVLDQLRVKLKIDPVRASAIRMLIETTIVSEVRYDLSDHLEFREGLKGIQHELHDPANPQHQIDPAQDHGFHVTGIIAARCNGFGIAGMVPFAAPIAYSLGLPPDYVLPMQALNDLGRTLDCPTQACVINTSWVDTRIGVGPEFLRDIETLSDEYLIVAAAGDRSGRAGPGGVPQGGPLATACDLVPACLGELPNVITVTSFLLDAPHTLDPLANYTGPGRAIVTLAAPGNQVLSPVRGRRLAALSGTSQAAAFVTGAAALLETVNHRLTAPQIKNRLLYTADLDFNYGGRVAFGRLNVKRAISHQSEDVVYLGGNQPRLGIFDYNVPGTRNSKRPLQLYRQGRESRLVPDARISRVRRIVRDPGSSRYTVVYESADSRQLKVERDVSFEPDDKPGYIGSNMTESFRLISCTRARTDESIPIRDWVVRCPGSARKVESINLAQVSDLIVRVDAGSH